MNTRNLRHLVVAVGLVAVAGVAAATTAHRAPVAARAVQIHTTTATPAAMADLPEVIVYAPAEMAEVIVYAPRDLAKAVVHTRHDLGDVMADAAAQPIVTAVYGTDATEIRVA